jgi:hypothetical protein
MSSAMGERVGRLGSGGGLGRLARLAAIGATRSGSDGDDLHQPGPRRYRHPSSRRRGGRYTAEPGLHMRNPLTTGIEEYPTFM